MRQSHLPEHCCRRRGIGWGDDRAKRDGSRPRHAGQKMRHHCNRCRCETDGNEDQARHRQPVVLEVAWGGIKGGVKKDRCQKERQCQLGFEDDARCARGEGKHGAAQSQERGVRRTDALGQQREKHRTDQNADDPLEDNHGLRPPVEQGSC